MQLSSHMEKVQLIHHLCRTWLLEDRRRNGMRQSLNVLRTTQVW